MEINSLILYGSPTKLTGSHKLVSGHHPYYVRVEPSKLDIVDALHKAKPKRGEIVLNTVPYETNT